MKNLRIIRIVLSLLVIISAVGYAFFSPPLQPLSPLVPYTQIIPSMLAVSIGAILFWLAATFMLGRVYCACFCPVGIIQDGVIRLRKALGKPPRVRQAYRPHQRIRYHILLVYVVCLLTGFLAVSYFIEPWQIFCNIASIVNPDAVAATWIRLGAGVLTGIICGIVSLLMIVVWAWVADRDFCNTVCPIGTALGLTEQYNLMHIEIDPDKCINCMKCEETCRSRCIKVAGRYVDNSRCVRCFDCLKECPNDAIRFQPNRNMPATPLSRRVGDSGG